MKYQYTSIIKKEKKWYVARCIELGVVSQGKSLEQADANLKEAVELYLEDFPKSKFEPNPSQVFVSTANIVYV